MTKRGREITMTDGKPARTRHRPHMGRRQSSTLASSTVTSSASSAYHQPKASVSSRAVWASRVCFLLTLVSVAASFGGFSYYLLEESEHELTEAQFASIADRATTSSREKMERKRLGVKSLATVIGSANPDASQWPFAVLNNYETIVKDLAFVSQGCRMWFAPIVEPSEVELFESFIYDFYERSRMPEPFPNGTAVQPFGKGVWSLNQNEEPFHDVNGTTSWGGNHTILVPLVHHTLGADAPLLNNLHADAVKGSIIETMMQCANEKAAAQESLDGCVAMSTSLPNFTSWTPGVESGPGAIMVQPVYPSNEPSKVRSLFSCIVKCLRPLECT